MPTLCTNTSRPPRRASASAIAARAASGSRRSARICAPSCTSMTATDAPCSRKAATIAAPKLPAPPATTTRCPSRPSQLGSVWSGTPMACCESLLSSVNCMQLAHDDVRAQVNRREHMKLVTFDDGKVGRIEGDRVIELDVPDMRTYYEHGQQAGETGGEHALADVRLRAPIVPKKFFHT